MLDLSLVRTLSALLLAIAIALTATACTGDEDSAEAPTATLAVSATSPPEITETPLPDSAAPATATATPIMGYAGYEIRGEFTFAAPVEFPENLMVIVEIGCTQCDAPSEALYRVWRNSGETQVERIVDAGLAEEQGSAYFLATAGRPDMGDMIVGVCTGGSCGGVAEVSPDAQIESYRSTDGGVTWFPFLTQPASRATWPALMTDEGILMAEGIAVGPKPRYSYVDGREVPLPENAQGLQAGGWAGEVRWITAAGNEVLNEDGSRLTIVEPGSMISAVAINREWRVPTPFVSWYESDSGRVVHQYVTRMTEDYFQVGYSVEGFISPQIVLSSGRILGRITKPGSYAGSIGFIDLSAGTLTPIGDVFLQPPFGDGQVETGRNNLLAAVEGPFLRVKTGSDCLNIRAEAGAQAQVLTCAADGVIAHDLQNSVQVGADEWRQVRLLDGREGFASAAFLSAD